MTEPCDLSALEARALIGARSLSPLELFDSCAKRIAERNGELNAFVALDLDGARELARQAESAVIRGEPLGALHGLPVGVKDMEATKGLVTTWGSSIYRGFVPTEDELHVRRIRSAGGIIIGKTNVPELGAGSNTVNPVYGATGNPFDSSLTCGGSSGGSAVALAAGMVPLATGSDFGGSLRTPAAFCGVVGFRPSPGLIPFPARQSLFSPMTVLGPMARSVADAHLLLLPQTGRDPHDPFSACDHPFDGDLAPADLSQLKAVFSADLGCAPMDSDIAAVFHAKTARFRSVFRMAEDRDPDFDEALETFETLRGLQMLTNFGQAVVEHRGALGPNVIAGVALGKSLGVDEIARAQRSQSRIYKRFCGLFNDADVLICPAASISPFPHALAFPTQINGVEMATYMSWYAIAYLLSLALPSIACIPCGTDHRGLPFGIQVIGPMGSDRKVLSIALALEGTFSSDEELRRPVPPRAV